MTQQFLPTLFLLVFAFLLIGLGMLFFNRKSIGGACGTNPMKEKKSKLSWKCPSQEAGICPKDDEEGYLEMATRSTRNQMG